MKTSDDKTPSNGNVTRRWLLSSSAKLTAGAVALCGTAAEVPAIATALDAPPEMTEEIARHFTTF
jgi:hypothetical protein